MPEDGSVVILDIGSISSTLIVWGQGQQYFTRDLPIGGHNFVKEISAAKDIPYTEAQDLLNSEGFSTLLDNSSSEGEKLSVTERSLYDNLVEDIRRSLRFYAKQTGQSFFLKIFLTGGAAETPGLTDLISSKLSIECDVFDPFDGLPGADELTITNSSQYTVALGLAVRGGLES